MHPYQWLWKNLISRLTASFNSKLIIDSNDNCKPKNPPNSFTQVCRGNLSRGDKLFGDSCQGRCLFNTKSGEEILLPQDR